MRNARLYLLLLLIVFMAVGLLRTIKKAEDRRGRVDRLAAEVADLEKTNEKLKEELAYRQGPAYVEQEARDKLKLVKEGEHLLILPDLPGSVIGAEATAAAKPPGPVWKQWWNVFFGGGR